VQDLISSGGAEFYYRLEFDTQPRVVFARPSVIRKGQATRVTLFGWNLSGSTRPASLKGEESITVPDEVSGAEAPLDSALKPLHNGGGFEQI
jgi:hypothetical protein